MSRDKVTIQTRVSPELKREAESVFGAMGLNLSEAIRIFLNQTVIDHAFPFQPRLHQPTVGLSEAIHELEEGGGERFDSASDFRASWENDP